MLPHEKRESKTKHRLWVEHVSAFPWHQSQEWKWQAVMSAGPRQGHLTFSPSDNTMPKLFHKDSTSPIFKACRKRNSITFLSHLCCYFTTLTCRKFFFTVNPSQNTWCPLLLFWPLCGGALSTHLHPVGFYLPFQPSLFCFLLSSCSMSMPTPHPGSSLSQIMHLPLALESKNTCSPPEMLCCIVFSNMYL